MLSRVIILGKIQIKRKRGFESALSCQKEGTATWCPSAVAFFLIAVLLMVLFLPQWGGGQRPFKHDLSASCTSAHVNSNFSNSKKVWFGVRRFLSKKL